MSAVFFAKAQAYTKNWTAVKTWKFDQGDLDFIEAAEVVIGNYGPAVMCHRKDGMATFINIDTRSNYEVGQQVDLSKATMVDYSDGSRTINKILIGVSTSSMEEIPF